MSTGLYTLFAVIIIIAVTSLTALVSLSGGFLLLSGSKIAKKFQKYGTFFAAIVLLYAAFGDIIPEVLEDGSLYNWQVALYVFCGLAICRFINFLASHFHRHGEHKVLKDRKQAIAMLIVDSLHTVVDGIVIGASFASGFGTGFIAAVATAAHEIPQEIGDFSIMIRSKMTSRKILKLQVISALILVPAAVVAFFIGDALAPFLPTLLSFIAGFFLYIAIGEISIIVKKIWNRAKKGINS